MPQTASCHCFLFLLVLCTLHLCPILAYMLKDCTIVHSAVYVLVNCEQRQLTSVPDGIPRAVTSLTLQNNNIRKINRTDFNNLSNLQELDLSDNAIADVDDGAFVHLVELKVLRMDHNHLTTLRDNMFQGLSNLLMLSVFDTNLQFINRTAFQSLTSLQALSFMSNQITDIITILQLPCLQVLNISIIESESFQSKDLPLNMSSELRELRIDSPSMKRFSITTAAFPHLETIDLSGCTGNYGFKWDIPDRYFLRNITKVYFDFHFISFASIRKALQSLDSLEYLQLTNMEKWIKMGLLNIACKIPTLRTLNLMYNFMDNLSEKLSPCTQLISLDLSCNNLNELYNDSLKEMKQLIHLNLAYNLLIKVPDDVKNLSMLQTLDLRYNRIHDLSCSDFLNLTRLTHLHLDTNLISELKPCVFQQLFDLKVLTVNHNSIWTIGDTFKTGLQKLELLDLNNNVILRELGKGEFQSLKSLKQLDVEIYFYRWNNTYFEGLDELKTLSLFFNSNPTKMTSSPPHDLSLFKSLKNFTIQLIQQTYDPFQLCDDISHMLSDMKHLEHFTAENVYIHECELRGRDTFKYAPQLKTLTLRRNNLPYLYPETFNPLQNLEALYLSNNKLKSLDFLAQANLTRLSWLDVSQNELTVINVSLFSFLPALRYVYMGDNPFACDCSNSDFEQWMLNNNQTQVVFAHSYTCGFPLAKKGTRFLDFDYHSCEPRDTSFIYYISTTCVIVLTLLASFTHHFLRLHLLYGYYLFLSFLYDAKERKRGSPQRYDAFISYNVHDELWVCREMLSVLEGEQGWRLCLHHRDFQPGKAIIENITEAIYSSRKTICVISRRYLESEWCSREFQMASYRLFDEKKDVLILVFLEDIPAQQLSPYYHMKRLVKRHSYLSWSQAGQHPGLFWQNLRRALDTPDTDLAFDE